MKTINYIILGIISAVLCACSTVKNEHHNQFNKQDRIEFAKKMHLVSASKLSCVQQKMIARITFYNKREAGGDRLASSSKGRAKEGITVAAHPDFPFGTKIVIPALKDKVGNGNFTIEDRGTAVTKKKASHGKAFVFDIYVNVSSRKDANTKITKLEHQIGDYAEVYVLKTGS